MFADRGQQCPKISVAYRLLDAVGMKRALALALAIGLSVVAAAGCREVDQEDEEDPSSSDSAIVGRAALTLSAQAGVVTKKTIIAGPTPEAGAAMCDRQPGPHQVFVTLKNPSAKTLAASVWASRAPNGPELGQLKLTVLQDCKMTHTYLMTAEVHRAVELRPQEEALVIAESPADGFFVLNARTDLATTEPVGKTRIVVPATVGGETKRTALVSTNATTKLPFTYRSQASSPGLSTPVFFSCGRDVAERYETAYVYVELKNPTARAVVVSILAAGDPSHAPIRTKLFVYDSPTLGDTTRCRSHGEDKLLAAEGRGITLPAGKSTYVLVAPNKPPTNHYLETDTDLAMRFGGSLVQLTVRTEAVD
jgi:hypothetical protein